MRYHLLAIVLLLTVASNAQMMTLAPEDTTFRERPGDLLILSAEQHRTSLLVGLAGVLAGGLLAATAEDEGMAIAGGCAGILGIGLSIHFGLSSANSLKRAGYLFNEAPQITLMLDTEE